jgi:hypothetical protein
MKPRWKRFWLLTSHVRVDRMTCVSVTSTTNWVVGWSGRNDTTDSGGWINLDPRPRHVLSGLHLLLPLALATTLRLHPLPSGLASSAHTPACILGSVQVCSTAISYTYSQVPLEQSSIHQSSLVYLFDKSEIGVIWKGAIMSTSWTGWNLFSSLIK